VRGETFSCNWPALALLRSPKTTATSSTFMDENIFFVCVSVRLSSMVRVGRQTFELPPHLPTYQAKKLVGVSRFSVQRQGSAVQCSGDSFLSSSVVADLFAHSTEMERRESKSSNIWLLIADQKIDRSSNFGFD
jgi:hypothetical protein